MKCKSIQFSKAIISPNTITDHYAIFLSIGNLIKNRNNTPNTFTTSKINISKLSNLIATQSWETVLDKNDVATDNFINIIKNLMKKATNNINISLNYISN
jgi:hypothetical protein